MGVGSESLNPKASSTKNLLAVGDDVLKSLMKLLVAAFNPIPKCSAFSK